MPVNTTEKKATATKIGAMLSRTLERTVRLLGRAAAPGADFGGESDFLVDVEDHLFSFDFDVEAVGVLGDLDFLE